MIGSMFARAFGRQPSEREVIVLLICGTLLILGIMAGLVLDDLVSVSG